MTGQVADHGPDAQPGEGHRAELVQRRGPQRQPATDRGEEHDPHVGRLQRQRPAPAPRPQPEGHEVGHHEPEDGGAVVPDVGQTALAGRVVGHLGDRQPDHGRPRQDGHVDAIERLDPVDVVAVAVVAGPAEVAQGHCRAGGVGHLCSYLLEGLSATAAADATPRRTP